MLKLLSALALSILAAVASAADLPLKDRLAASEGTLEERMAEPPLYEAISNKKIVDLEFCVARAMAAGEGIANGGYHDGPHRYVAFSRRITEYKIFMVVTLTESDTQTKIDLRGRNEKAVPAFREMIEQCI